MMKLFAKFHKIKFKKDKINLDKKKTIRKNKLKKKQKDINVVRTDPIFYLAGSRSSMN